MTLHDAGDLARRLAENAEAVCRRYLSAGRRHGNYWLVGDVRNAPGRSLFVRLHDTANGRAGKWTDASTGEHGDLLDVIRESLGLADFRDVADEARAFLSLPRPIPVPLSRDRPAQERGPASSSEAARRLWAMSGPITGTSVEAYLRRRDITLLHGTAALRFHPNCYYRPDEDSPTETWPAMIAAVTDLDGALTGVHRTWLAAEGRGKAPVDHPRRALGGLLGHAVRFGVGSDVLAAGEGIETVLSLRQVLPDLPLAACLSSAHLASLIFPPLLRRLYVLRDDDGRTHHVRFPDLDLTGDARTGAIVETRNWEDAKGTQRLSLATQTGLEHRPVKEGEIVSGVYRQRVALSSGRFAMVDDGLGFQLVPWHPALEQKLGRQVSGTLSPGGSVDWNFGRKRGLGI